MTVAEGANGTKEIEVIVTLSSLVGRDVTFDWSLLQGTATMGTEAGFRFQRRYGPWKHHYSRWSEHRED
jgi:hypothetical protein